MIAALARLIRRPAAVPMVLQMEATECGAACLAMVLGHFGRWVPLEQLREACGVSRDGVQASRLVQVAGDHGLLAQGYAPEVEALATLGFPQILFWRFSHFVVLTGIDRQGRARVHDPARGPLTLGPVELREGYSGISLVMRPGPGFVRQGRRPDTLRAVWARLAPERGLLTALVAVSLLLAVPGVLLPSFTRLFIDEVLVRRLEGWLAPLVAGTLATGVLAAALTRLQQRWLLRLEHRLAVGEALRLLWHALSLPMAYFAQRSAPEVAGRLSLTDALATASGGPLGRAATGMVSAAVFLVVMALIDARLTVAVLLLGLMQFELTRCVAKGLATESRRAAQLRGEFEATALGTVGALGTWRATGQESLALARWNAAAQSATSAETRLALHGLWIPLLPMGFGLLAQAMVLWLGGLGVMASELSLGMLVAFLALTALWLAPLADVARAWGTVEQITGSLERIDDVHRYPAPPLEASAPSHEQTQMMRVGPAALRVSGLGHRYGPHAEPVLEGVDFSLRAGEWLAVMGRSGSGKSTLGLLLAGLIPPPPGTVWLDGDAVDRLPSALFRASVAYVEQEPRLFEGSLRDNLTLWDAEVDDSALHAATRIARLHEEILGRPGDYEGRIGPRGAGLSGGQAQRLAIARALLRRPRLLILDEATSALDALTERALCAALKTLPMSVIFITHRQTPLAWCDQLIVLEAGRIGRRRQRVRRGTPR